MVVSAKLNILNFRSFDGNIPNEETISDFLLILYTIMRNRVVVMLHKKYMKYIDAFNNAYKSVNKTYVPTDARKPSKINGF